MNSKSSSFVVVLRGPAAVYFEREEYLRITDFPGPAGALTLVLQTRYLDLGLGTDFPGQMWVEVRGPADGLDSALGFANAALDVVPLLSFGVNAGIGIPKVELAFENTSGKEKREFFQQFVPEERTPGVSRKVRVEPIGALIQQVMQHPEFERLYRAITQYSLALLNWDGGKGILATAHLYMGVEALTPVVRRRLCRERGAENEQLATALGVTIQELDPTIRKELIFQGDNDCYQDAKAASDGFEHGFRSFPDIRTLGEPVRKKTADYLRTAILKELLLEPTTINELTRPSYDQPLGSWQIERKLRGHLLGGTDDLSADGQVYPIMHWKSKVKSVTRTEAGEYKVSFDEKLTASLGPGISFRPASYEIWGPTGFKRKEPPETDLEED
ncbi:MAG: hypothetical protein P8020_22020 [Acidobacteriota bacterium]